MDNISHAALGASITQALRGKRYGNKAAVYAMLVSNLPDIDVFARLIPGLDSTAVNFFHRTATHSLLFAIIIAPILGRIMSRLMKTGRSSWKERSLITLVCVLAHIFLDWCTSYGTWFLWPFSNIGFTSNIIGIVDLFFTLPLVAFVIWTMIRSRKNSKKRIGILRYVGLAYATLYLALMTIVHYSLESSVAHDMEQAHVQYKRIETVPQMLQPFLWYAIVELPNGSYKTTYTSIFDHKPRTYENIYGYHELGNPSQTGLNELIQRSHGRYQLGQDQNQLTFADLRFGQLLGWDKESRGGQIFSYYINPQTGELSAKFSMRFKNSFSETWKKYWKRVRGN